MVSSIANARTVFRFQITMYDAFAVTVLQCVAYLIDVLNKIQLLTGVETITMRRDSYTSSETIGESADFLQESVQLPMWCIFQHEVKAFFIVEDVIHG
jgi:hypothetical protein